MPQLQQRKILFKKKKKNSTDIHISGEVSITRDLTTKEIFLVDIIGTEVPKRDIAHLQDPT